MTFEPGTEAYIAKVVETFGTWPAAKTVAERRARMERYADVHKVPYPPGLEVRDEVLAAPGRTIPLRVYRPAGRAPRPTVIYFHGGGWVAGSVDSHDTITAGLAAESGAQVISVAYRLAPEHPYPAATEDCFEALRRIADGAFEADPERLAVAGDSAGGNLAAACALIARDRGGPALRLQALIYPVLDDDVDRESYLTANDPFLTRDSMIYYLDAFLPAATDRDDGHALPLRAADLAGLPPAYLLAAEHDPLRDETLAYAERLRAAGVETTCRLAPGAIHGYLRARFVSAVAAAEFDRLAGAIRAII